MKSREEKIIDMMAEYIGHEDVSEEFCRARYNPIPTECDENCALCVKKYFEERCNNE